MEAVTQMWDGLDFQFLDILIYKTENVEAVFHLQM